jgi:hypothetical protein
LLAHIIPSAVLPSNAGSTFIWRHTPMGIRREQHPLTDERKQTFLKVLAETGSPSAAAHAATPWSTCPKGGIATFGQARKRDLVFSDAWDRAMDAATAKVEAEVMRRAMTPTKRPIFSKGELKGYTEDWDNRLLLA